MSGGLASDEIAGDYKRALEELHESTRQDINHLTLIAGESIEHAAAIARTLENHIKTVNPNRKLPALYLLDSIIKNVGTPYTLFFGSNLYSTFMNAYSLVSPYIRQKLDEMLGTWKLPNPGSTDPSPVLPPETVRPIEQALNKAKAAAFEQQRRDQLRAQQEALARSRQSAQTMNMWTSTPTPPPMQQLYAPPQTQYPPISYEHPNVQPKLASTPDLANYAQSNKPEQTAPVDLSALHKDIGDLIWSTRSQVALNPQDMSTQTRLKALLDLQNLLRQQYHPPDQLQQVRNQVSQLRLSANTASSVPNSTSHIPSSQNSDSAVRYSSPIPQTQAPAATFPPPPPPEAASHKQSVPSVDISALLANGNLANLIAKTRGGGAITSMPQALRASATPPPKPATALPSPGNNTAALLASLQARGLLGANGSASLTNPPRSLTSEGLSRINAVNDVELTSASLKIPRPHLISIYYEALPNQCTTCGKRFRATESDREAKRRHYDWHFKTNQKMNEALKRPLNRSWYVSELEWIRSRDDPEGNLLNTLDTVAENAKNDQSRSENDPKSKYVSVPTASGLIDQPCPICQEKFTASYNESVSDWVWMDAIQIGARVYHASCQAEVKKQGSRENTPARVQTPDSVLGKRKAGNLGLG